MIPHFPEFKSLELSDRQDVGSFTNRLPPYSDFDFASMWSWDIKGEVRISQLNDNLVVRFCDYLTGEPFYSFLGENEINDTVEKLLAVSKGEGMTLILKLIPEEAIKGLDQSRFLPLEDRDHFDYVYGAEDHKDFLGAGHKNSRRRIKSFSQNKDITVRELSFASDADCEDILKVNDLWKENKHLDFDSTNEDQSLKRFLQVDSPHSLHLGVFVDGKLVAYTLNEKCGKYALSHFAKFDIRYSGAYLYSMKATAEKILEQGMEYLNCEQDMGLPGLRSFKESLCPVLYLKKYTITASGEVELLPK